jgi:hypothetical protein
VKTEEEEEEDEEEEEEEVDDVSAAAGCGLWWKKLASGLLNSNVSVSSAMFATAVPCIPRNDSSRVNSRWNFASCSARSFVHISNRFTSVASSRSWIFASRSIISAV